MIQWHLNNVANLLHFTSHLMLHYSQNGDRIVTIHYYDITPSYVCSQQTTPAMVAGSYAAVQNVGWGNTRMVLWRRPWAKAPNKKTFLSWVCLLMDCCLILYHGSPHRSTAASHVSTPADLTHTTTAISTHTCHWTQHYLHRMQGLCSFHIYKYALIIRHPMLQLQ